MKLSVKSDYALRALLGLARHYYDGHAVKIEELATAYGVPQNYLVQILLELKSKHLVRSLRGKDGGYLLVREPSKITMGDVLRAMHGEVFDTPALHDPNTLPELREAWVKLQRVLDEAADSITLQDLVDRCVGDSQMYYI